MTHSILQPRFAVVHPDGLAIMGMRQLLQSAMPQVEILPFLSTDQLLQQQPEGVAHYFVAQSEVVTHRSYYLEHRQRTIVLTVQTNPSNQLEHFRSLCTHLPEPQLARALMALIQTGHPGGRGLPPQAHSNVKRTLSDREVEVLSLLVQGHLNKEVATMLNISLTTVISHRKNISEKLGMKSLSALTIYAVNHGYVQMEQI